MPSACCPNLAGRVVKEAAAGANDQARCCLLGVLRTDLGSLVRRRLLVTLGRKMRVKTSGTSPTTVQAKIWAASGTEPASWQVTATEQYRCTPDRGRRRLRLLPVRHLHQRTRGHHHRRPQRHQRRHGGRNGQAAAPALLTWTLPTAATCSPRSAPPAPGRNHLPTTTATTPATAAR